jgi:hypothetical protein
LVSGVAPDVDVADFPRLAKRLVRRGQEVETHDFFDVKKGFGSP